MCVHVCVQSCLTLQPPRTVAHQAPLSLEFSRQEYWNRLLFPTPGDLLNPEIKLCLLCLLHWQEDSLPLASPERPPNFHDFGLHNGFLGVS